MRVILAALLLLASITPALARDNGQWDASPAEIGRWFADLKQPDNPRVSCCGEADAYYADSFEVSGDEYVAIITDEREVPGRIPRAVGTRIRIPNAKLKYDKGNPTGHGVVFLGTGGEVYCYVTPGGV